MREAHVYSEIVPHDLSADELRTRRPAGIILSGGPSSVYEPGAPQVDPGLFSLGVPVLGICYGHQLMARALGGEVAATGQREYGGTTLTVDGGSRLLQDFPASDTVWMSHGDAVTREPEGFRVMARTDQIPIAAMEDPARGMYAVQFHPEVSHTSHGQDVMKRFLYEGCDLLPDWTPTNIIDDQVARIRSQVGEEQVLCALSGGVDSAVAALLVHRAVGDQLTCVFVDHGLNREGEPDQVEETFARHFRIPLVHVKAADRFLGRLAGVTDPEVKRKTIGEEFIRVFEEVAREQASSATFLVQGTLYPDVIESGVEDRRQHQEPPQRGRVAGGHGLLDSSNRCATCSRTRCGRWAASWGCPRRSCSASRSLDRGWRCASWARSPPRTWRRCAAPTSWCARRSGAPGSNVTPGRRSACCSPTCRAWA